MADKLKNFFNEQMVRSIGRDIRQVHARFDEKGFVKLGLARLHRLELLARGSHVADALHEYLPRNFPRAARILVDSLGPEHERTESFGFTPFRYLPHVTFIARFGLDHFEESMQAQYELTKRFTAEASIRPFLIQYPERALARLTEWSRDPNPHVRRLVSEGTRPLLPWAPRLRMFQEDPRPVLRLLERLKDDPERYVQRSVANSLNDISKDHADTVMEVCQRWLSGASSDRKWIVRHALRTLVKRRHRGALGLLGAGTKPRIQVEGVRFAPKRVRLGATLEVSFSLRSTGKLKQSLLVDYAVHYVKASGKRSEKVFKLCKLSLDAGEAALLSLSVSFADLTTRKHHPGKHAVDVIVNGEGFLLGEISVTR